MSCGANLAAQPPSTTYHAPALVEPLASQPTAVMVVPAGKTKSASLAIEAVAAVFGIFGVGWLYSGNTALGILLLIIGLCWDVLVCVVLLLSFGLGMLCLLPIHMLLVVGSVVSLNLAVPKAA